MPIAHKQHYCDLCYDPIIIGEHYVYRTITPWDHPDNIGFGTFKAHTSCESLWANGIGRELNWSFPTDKHEWIELVECNRSIQLG